MEGTTDSDRKKNVDLEAIADLQQGIAEEHAPKLAELRTSSNAAPFKVHLYNHMYRQLGRLEELQRMTIDVQQVRDFVDAEKRHELGDDTLAQLRGLFSGALLHRMTENNWNQGVRTYLRIDGEGCTFPYLFAFARKTDHLFLHDFKGDGIGSYMGSNGGLCNMALFRDIEGSDTGRCIASERGSANLVAGVGLKGLGVLSSVGSHEGNVNFLQIADCEGKMVGYEFVAYGGTGRHVVGMDIKGDFTLSHAGHQGGKLDQAILVNCEGHRVMSCVGNNGFVDLAVLVNVTGSEAAYNAGSGGRLRTLLLNNIIGDQPANDASVDKLIIYGLKTIVTDRRRDIILIRPYNTVDEVFAGRPRVRDDLEVGQLKCSQIEEGEYSHGDGIGHWEGMFMKYELPALSAIDLLRESRTDDGSSKLMKQLGKQFEPSLASLFSRYIDLRDSQLDDVYGKINSALPGVWTQKF